MSTTSVIQGRVHKVFDTTTNKGGYQNREIVLETELDTQHPQKPKFDTRKPDLFDGLKPGDMVNVSYNINGREYPDKNTGELRYFTTLSIWRVEKIGGNEPVDSGVERDDEAPF